MKYHIALSCLLFLFLGSSQVRSQAIQVNYTVENDKDVTCLLASFAGSFMVPFENNEGGTSIATFYIPKDAAVSQNMSQCGSENASLAIQFSGYNLTLNFQTMTNNTQFGLSSIVFQYVQDKANFPGAKDNVTTMVKNQDIGNVLAPLGESYKCNSDELVMVNNTNVTFSAAQVQPFKVQNGTFSNATVCAADMTTPAPATTAQHSTMTQPPDVPFDVKDANGTVCLKATLGIEFNLPYKKKDNTTGMAKFDLPLGTKVDADKSKCGSTVSRLVLNFPDTDYNITFDFVKDGDMFYANVTTLDYIQDDVHFVNASTKGSMKAQTTQQLFKAAVNKSYECQADQTYNFTSGGTLMTSGVRLQPFNIMNNSFSAADVCNADNPSTAPPTTQVTTVAPPTSPPQPKAGSWNITSGNKTCMLMKMAISFNFTYENDKNKTVTVAMDVNPNMTNSSESSCGNTTSSFVLLFTGYENWMMNMTFTTSSSSEDALSASGSGTYSLDSFTLNYVYTDDVFPGVKDEGKQMTSHSNETEFKVDLGNSYKCDKAQTYKLDNFTKVTLSDVKIQPFAGKSEGGYGTEEDCEADQSTSNIVPIAVGCALAGLVIIVLIAYLIGRRRSHAKGYQSV